MNIFILDENIPDIPVHMSDQHIVKMLLETAQILCSVHHLSNPDRDDIPYRLTHAKHPCVLWAMESIENYTYLCFLGSCIACEYSFRFPLRTHKSAEVIYWAAQNTPILCSDGLTPHVQCMPTEYQQSDAVEAYRQYYVYKYMSSMHDKRRRMRFTNRPIPNFILEAI